MAKGGARFGAGRPAYKAKAEQLMRVDIREWHRRGFLGDGHQGSWSWNRGGEPVGNIGFSVSNHAVHLNYFIGGRDASQTIIRAQTPCHYGGFRQWFKCPTCQRRTALLYLLRGRFACRHCQQVAYSSQSEDVLGRMWRKQGGIEARLGEDWTRPKGMRQRTYERLLDRLQDCDARRELAFWERFSRLKGV